MGKEVTVITLILVVIFGYIVGYGVMQDNQDLTKQEVISVEEVAGFYPARHNSVELKNGESYRPLNGTGWFFYRDNISEEAEIVTYKNRYGFKFIDIKF